MASLPYATVSAQMTTWAGGPDFGLARVVLDVHGALMTGGLGTFQWMAPEVLAHQRYSEKADVFSCAPPGQSSQSWLPCLRHTGADFDAGALCMCVGSHHQMYM